MQPLTKAQFKHGLNGRIQSPKALNRAGEIIRRGISLCSMPHKNDSVLLHDKRGQSSVADALFFFSIASILALFLFVFATNYGTTLRTQTDKEQFREYASSALKTILYTSTPRNPCCTLDECRTDLPCNFAPGTKPEEIDFLLAAAKEDYADDGNFGDTAVTIKNTLRGIMQPLSTSADYIFFFYMPTEPQYQFPYFLFYRSVSNPARDPNKCGGEKGCHEFWYCKPNALENVNTFLFSLSNFSRTSSKARFLSASPIPGQTPRQVDSEIHFVLWPSVTFDDSSPTGAYQGLRCCKPEPVGIPENQTPCYRDTFVSNPKVGGGVSFEIVPNSIRFAPGETQKTVAFKLRNKNSKDMILANVIDMLAGGPNACPVQLPLPSFSPFPSGAVAITNDELQGNGPNYLGLGYFVQGDNGADEPFSDNPVGQLDRIRALYAQAPPTYNVSLYRLDQQSKNVNRPTPSFLPCQFELRYRLQNDTDDRILHAQLSISAEQ